MDDPAMVSMDEDAEERASAEAGVVRGLARSIQTTGRQAARFPAVGRLPAASRLPSRIPVKQVAKISDRVSTGWDVWDTANETGAWKLSRLRPFVISLVKNTVLGAAVFETYGYAVEHMAPPPKQDEEADEYARASTPVHFVAGAIGGSVHGIVGTLWETAAGERTLRTLPKMTLHHSSAHAALFGSYEALKRLFLENLGLDSRSYQGPAYLGSISIAGGVAGQVQHIVSHFSEQWLRLEETEATAVRTIRPPVMRNVLMAFPASAVAFVAFEYGRSP